MEQWVLKILKNEREKRKLPLEVKRLNNNFYLYHSTTRWDNIEVAFDALKILRKAKLVDKVSVNEVLLELSKVYEIHLGEKRKLSEIPEKVMKLAESLELNIFPTKLRS